MDARDKADKIRRAARDGIDLRMQRLKKAGARFTFRQAFEAYFERQAPAALQCEAPQAVAEHDGDVRVSLFSATCRSLKSHAHVLAALEPIWFDKPETAKRVLQRIEAVFKSAILRGSREKASPCVGIAEELGTRHREVEHHAALPWKRSPRSSPCSAAEPKGMADYPAGIRVFDPDGDT